MNEKYCHIMIFTTNTRIVVEDFQSKSFPICNMLVLICITLIFNIYSKFQLFYLIGLWLILFKVILKG